MKQRAPDQERAVEIAGRFAEIKYSPIEIFAGPGLSRGSTSR